MPMLTMPYYLCTRSHLQAFNNTSFETDDANGCCRVCCLYTHSCGCSCTKPYYIRERRSFSQAKETELLCLIIKARSHPASTHSSLNTDCSYTVSVNVSTPCHRYLYVCQDDLVCRPGTHLLHTRRKVSASVSDPLAWRHLRTCT